MSQLRACASCDGARQMALSSTQQRQLAVTEDGTRAVAVAAAAAMADAAAATLLPLTPGLEYS